jgi:hypothetical protein
MFLILAGIAGLLAALSIHWLAWTLRLRYPSAISLLDVVSCSPSNTVGQGFGPSVPGHCPAAPSGLPVIPRYKAAMPSPGNAGWIFILCKA